ncbi:hypothetical protein RYX36_024799 [Vicia faba]
MENQVIVIVIEESKSSVPINLSKADQNQNNDSKKCTTDQVFAMEESDSRDEKTMEVVSSSCALCIVLLLFPFLKLASCDFGGVGLDIMVLSIIPMVQTYILWVTLTHHVNRTIFYTILIASLISALEVSFVSWSTSITDLITWGNVLVGLTINNHFVDLLNCLKKLGPN